MACSNNILRICSFSGLTEARRSAVCHAAQRNAVQLVLSHSQDLVDLQGRALFSAPVQEPHLLPFYARVAASLAQVFPDIAAYLLRSLEEEFAELKVRRSASPLAFSDSAPCVGRWMTYQLREGSLHMRWQVSSRQPWVESPKHVQYLHHCWPTRTLRSDRQRFP